ncbi:helix-turn-helix transcriptional regulator [Fluviicola sp.]|jgi:transcriptional regulator with XRE-family HTH domain|uniref:helix-turn-helix domain-containing protein n=1 Tax=Fluviicola sp. TaxID=1917219 RepID=UPI00283119AB|nr:helix-turn-helix transcriptional regulator [Fluviicola sp.]MDR0802899.1 helix-turn-helix transcriptional regulator [Fluviicola sp.]
MVSDSQIGRNIKNLCEMRNFTQEYMSEQLSISQKQYSRIENGEISVSIQQLFAIAAILNISVQLILEFNASLIFNNLNSGGEFKAFNNTPVEQIETLYEKLLHEKDRTIKLLEEKCTLLVNGKSG